MSMGFCSKLSAEGSSCKFSVLGLKVPGSFELSGLQQDILRKELSFVSSEIR